MMKAVKTKYPDDFPAISNENGIVVLHLQGYHMLPI